MSNAAKLRPRTYKPRKQCTCPYAKRRQYTKELREEVYKLESEMAVLQTRALPSEQRQNEPADKILHQAADKKTKLNSCGRTNGLHIAKAQSLMSRCLGDHQSYPLYTRICLTADWNKRREVITAMKMPKLRAAYEFVMARANIDKKGQSTFSENRFETENGDVCCVRNQTVHFPGVESLQQVFDALMFFYNNVEISISERLGHVTVREDYDTIEGTAFNYRVISTNEYGVTTEANAVLFSQIFGVNDVGFGSEPCAVVAIDCVDEDALHPYNPTERVRMDGPGAVVLTAHRSTSKCSDTQDASAAGELVVTMRCTAFLKIHCPVFVISDVARQDFHDGIARWGDVLVKSVRNAVYYGA